MLYFADIFNYLDNMTAIRHNYKSSNVNAVIQSELTKYQVMKNLSW